MFQKYNDKFYIGWVKYKTTNFIGKGNMSKTYFEKLHFAILNFKQKNSTQ